MPGQDKKTLTIALSITSALWVLAVTLGMYIQQRNVDAQDLLREENRRCHDRIDKNESSAAGMTVRLEFIQRDLSKVLASVEEIQKKMTDSG